MQNNHKHLKFHNWCIPEIVFLDYYMSTISSKWETLHNYRVWWLCSGWFSENECILAIEVRRPWNNFKNLAWKKIGKSNFGRLFWGGDFLWAISRKEKIELGKEILNFEEGDFGLRYEGIFTVLCSGMFKWEKKRERSCFAFFF